MDGGNEASAAPDGFIRRGEISTLAGESSREATLPWRWESGPQTWGWPPIKW